MLGATAKPSALADRGFEIVRRAPSWADAAIDALFEGRQVPAYYEGEAAGVSPMLRSTTTGNVLMLGTAGTETYGAFAESYVSNCRHMRTGAVEGFINRHPPQPTGYDAQVRISRPRCTSPDALRAIVPFPADIVVHGMGKKVRGQQDVEIIHPSRLGLGNQYPLLLIDADMAMRPEDIGMRVQRGKDTERGVKGNPNYHGERIYHFEGFPVVGFGKMYSLPWDELCIRLSFAAGGGLDRADALNFFGKLNEEHWCVVGHGYALSAAPAKSLRPQHVEAHNYALCKEPETGSTRLRGCCFFTPGPSAETEGLDPGKYADTILRLDRLLGELKHLYNG